MELDSASIKNLIMLNKGKEIEESLNSGWDPNVEGGWAVRLAARQGCCSIVEILIRHGANPYLLSESGASTLQLAVYSGENWGNGRWSFLLSCCDSSQLADGAAVAIIFNNFAALEKILETGRCNTHIPTSLTGKTLEQLAKGYKMSHLLNLSILRRYAADGHMTSQSPREHRSGAWNKFTQQEPQKKLSPSVARFFRQTAGQSGLTSPRSTTLESSPTAQYFN